MPRYFFLRTNGGVSPDSEGSELSGLQEARIEAVAYAAETLKDHPDIIWSGQELRVQVSDESGKVLFKVRVSLEEE